MKKILLLFVLSGSLLMANGQVQLEVIASGGGYFSDPNLGSLSWTLGETVVETVSNSSINIILTQGFQQPDEKAEPIGIRNVSENSVFANVYPNPTIKTIRIDLKYDNTSRLKIELVDMLGQVLHSEEMDVLKAQLNNYQLDVSALAAGMYMFRLSDEGKAISTYKFQKIGY